MADKAHDNDKSLVGISAEYLPEIDDLPGDLANVARIIDRVAPGYGVLSVLALADEYRSTPLYIHNLDKLKRTVRDKKIIDKYTAGERAECIARSVGISLRHFWTIVGRDHGVDTVDDGRQMKLF